MDKDKVQVVLSGPSQDCVKILSDFNIIHEKSKGFKEIDSTTKEVLWDALFERCKATTGTEDEDNLKLVCLSTMRLLSREKEVVENVMSDDRVSILLTVSDLSTGEEELIKPKSIEALKVIFNMVFQSPTLQIMFISGGILKFIMLRIGGFTSLTTSTSSIQEFEYFTNRILFLITALCQDTAPAKVRNLFNGLSVLAAYLESKISRLMEEEALDTGSVVTTSDIICEVLKILYNLISELVGRHKRASSEEIGSGIDEDDMEQLKRITRNVRVLLVDTNGEVPELGGDGVWLDALDPKYDEVRKHSVDLLAAFPPPCFEEFVPTLPTGSEVPYKMQDHDMSAVEATLQFFITKLEAVKKSALPPENIAPPLLALHNMAVNYRVIRKYLKMRILPPLSRKDVEQLPEEGSSVRNKLVALLTVPITHITDLAANLLFVLCKEKVGKLVKYTGYGNAAGLLAKRGLMLGGRPPPGKYSDTDSEESDTDEYKEIEHTINHIEGRIQQDHPNPMEGMTDEQKEYEAAKLIAAIDKLDRSGGGLRPCRIGPDGRPEPIAHVLQLQDALENPMKGLRREDTDSDSD